MSDIRVILPFFLIYFFFSFLLLYFLLFFFKFVLLDERGDVFLFYFKFEGFFGRARALEKPINFGSFPLAGQNSGASRPLMCAQQRRKRRRRRRRERGQTFQNSADDDSFSFSSLILF